MMNIHPFLGVKFGRGTRGRRGLGSPEEKKERREEWSKLWTNTFRARTERRPIKINIEKDQKRKDFLSLSLLSVFVSLLFLSLTTLFFSLSLVGINVGAPVLVTWYQRRKFFRS